jgi:glyoxylase I family protein
MAITSKSVAHVSLTVTDIDRSRQFHDAVFGGFVAMEVPDNADEATGSSSAFCSAA